MCGDSTNEEDVIELLHGNATDICITSPPYNAGLTPSEIQSGKKKQSTITRVIVRQKKNTNCFCNKVQKMQ